MAMRGNFQLAGTDAVEGTLSITMTIGEWKRAVAALPTAGDAGAIGTLARRLVAHADQTFKDTVGA